MLKFTGSAEKKINFQENETDAPLLERNTMPDVEN